MIEKTYVWCKNYNEFSELMKILHSKGYKWASGESTLEWEPYPINRDKNMGMEIEISPSYIIRYGCAYDAHKGVSFTAFMIKEGIKMDKFTKADLEDGMIMKLRDDRYYMYFKKFNKGVRYGGCITLEGYNDDLIYNSPIDRCYCKENDIVAVYSPENLNSLDFKLQVKNLNLIWERPEEVVMTISEIEEKLGITNLKIVKE